MEDTKECRATAEGTAAAAPGSEVARDLFEFGRHPFHDFEGDWIGAGLIFLVADREGLHYEMRDQKTGKVTTLDPRDSTTWPSEPYVVLHAAGPGTA